MLKYNVNNVALLTDILDDRPLILNFFHLFLTFLLTLVLNALIAKQI